MTSLKHRKYPVSHRLISFLRDLDLKGIRRLSVDLPKILLPDPGTVGPHILQTIHGFQMKIDPSRDSGVELSLFQTGTYEKGTLHLLQKLLQPGDTFVDIGANIGLMSVFAAGCVGEKGKVLAFEAHPETFDWLNFNVALNHAACIETYGFALGNETGSAVIYDNWDINRGGASLVVRQENATGHTVEVKTLDDVLDSDISPKLIKVDVEGFELPVLRGAAQTIRRSRPVLIVEYSVNRDNQYESTELIDFIESFGFYKLFKLSGTKERKSELTEIKSRAELPDHDNIICIPS